MIEIDVAGESGNCLLSAVIDDVYGDDILNGLFLPLTICSYISNLTCRILLEKQGRTHK